MGEHQAQQKYCLQINTFHLLLQVYWINPWWSNILLEKLIVAQMAFYGSSMSITMFGQTYYWTLSWIGWIQPTSLLYCFNIHFNIILSSSTRLGLCSDPFPSSFLTQTLYILLIYPMHVTYPIHDPPDLITLVVFDEEF
jgi:hypothetical protein